MMVDGGGNEVYRRLGQPLCLLHPSPGNHAPTAFRIGTDNWQIGPINRARANQASGLSRDPQPPNLEVD